MSKEKERAIMQKMVITKQEQVVEREKQTITREKQAVERSKFLMGKIDYINASPVYYGLDHGLVPNWIEMIEGPPAVLNGMIKNRELEISPISSAFYAMNHKELLILPDLSISSQGEVLSVILMTNYPIEELDGKTIILTQDSATSSALVRLIAIQKGIRPNFITGKLRTLEDIPDNIAIPQNIKVSDNIGIQEAISIPNDIGFSQNVCNLTVDAAMIIGDAAMTQPWEKKFKYRIDLGKLWYETTGLPFVFALWVVRRECAISRYNDVKDALELFYESRNQGYIHIDKVIESGAKRLGLDNSYVSRYFELLHCNLDELKIKGLEYFFLSLYENSLLPEKVDIKFLSYNS
ncbi:MAG: menaquinone biosynthesis protein [Desulfamplus sp.]|nr:menaquinone biosynthesis protein [Desulfamplus sp.]